MTNQERYQRSSFDGREFPYGKVIALLAAIFWILPMGFQMPEAGGQSTRPRVLPRNMPQVPMCVHPWGNFEAGAWRTSRTVVEKQEPGRTDSRATTENRITLQEKGSLLKLVLESQISLMGRSVRIEPKQTVQNVYGISGESRQTVRSLPQETLVVEGQPILCDVVQGDFFNHQSARQVKIWYNCSRVPYVFRREVRAWNPRTGAIEETTSMNVTSMNMQALVLGKLIPGYQYVQVSHFPDYTTRETVVASVQVPGAVITKAAQDTNASGQLLQTVTVELLGYGCNASDSEQDLGPGVAVRATHGTVAHSASSSPSVRQVEFSLEFSHTKGAHSEEDSTRSEMTRFHERWTKTRVIPQSVGKVPETTLSLSDFDNLSSNGQVCRSPIYNNSFRSSTIARSNTRVISTESLRLSMYSGNRAAFSDNSDQDRNRGSWRRHWRSLWFQDKEPQEVE